jgi:cytochrome c551/c552
LIMRVSGKLLPLACVALALGMLAGCDDATEKQAIAMTGGNPHRGKDAINYYGCASCHTIPGIRGADGLVGPPLDRIASRGYIGGVLRNTPANMLRWLQNPPAVDDKTAMPNLHMTDADAKDIACYLYTLQ